MIRRILEAIVEKEFTPRGDVVEPAEPPVNRVLRDAGYAMWNEGVTHPVMDNPRYFVQWRHHDGDHGVDIEWDHPDKAMAASSEMYSAQGTLTVPGSKGLVISAWYMKHPTVQDVAEKLPEFASDAIGKHKGYEEYGSSGSGDVVTTKSGKTLFAPHGPEDVVDPSSVPNVPGAPQPDGHGAYTLVLDGPPYVGSTLHVDDEEIPLPGPADHHELMFVDQKNAEKFGEMWKAKWVGWSDPEDAAGYSWKVIDEFGDRVAHG